MRLDAASIPLCCMLIFASGQLIDDLSDLVTSAPLAVEGSAVNPIGQTPETVVPGVPCSLDEASWLTWGDWSSCTDSCGSCGMRMRTRACLTMNAQCSCSGDSTEIEYCNFEICRYPRTTCCFNLKVTTLDGRFACLQNSSSTPFG